MLVCVQQDTGMLTLGDEEPVPTKGKLLTYLHASALPGRGGRGGRLVRTNRARGEL